MIMSQWHHWQVTPLPLTQSRAVHTFLVDIILGNDTAEAKIQELQRSKRSNDGREAYKLLQFVLCWQITPTHVVGSVRAKSQTSEPIAPTTHT